MPESKREKAGLNLHACMQNAAAKAVSKSKMQKKTNLEKKRKKLNQKDAFLAHKAAVNRNEFEPSPNLNRGQNKNEKG